MTAQPPSNIITSLTYDPFVPDAQAANGGDLLAHYPAPLVDRGDVFMEFKTGSWSEDWSTQIWNIKRLSWRRGALVEQWTFQSDWKPEPDQGGLGGWEPVFHAVLANGFVYVPGANGSIHRIRRRDGSEAAVIDPFGGDRAAYVSGPLTADNQGNIYYNALRLNPDKPWSSDVQGSWLVKVGADDSVTMVDYATITPGAPAPAALCNGSFPASALPWPPSPTARPAQSRCGSQRPGVNIAPAIAIDGTIYTVSRAHLNSRYAFIAAVNPDLTPKWVASLRGHLHDGCGTETLPPNGAPGGCRDGAPLGVDPATNEAPAGRVTDQSSSTPVVAPDGSVLYGSFTAYNYERGHLFKFAPDGTFLASYDFGWDTTPAIYPHGGTYSVILKDNHYDTGSYCGDPQFCPAVDGGPYSITRLTADLKPEWSFVSANTNSCERQDDGTLACASDHPFGFEWCINAPAVDARGTVYANSEDGNLYVIDAHGQLVTNLFLNLAIGAAYTPLAIGDDGLIYTENDGRLFVVGANASSPGAIHRNPDHRRQSSGEIRLRDLRKHRRVDPSAP